MLLYAWICCTYSFTHYTDGVYSQSLTAPWRGELPLPPIIKHKALSGLPRERWKPAARTLPKASSLRTLPTTYDGL
jgi:hypothetical protein